MWLLAELEIVSKTENYRVYIGVGPSLGAWHVYRIESKDVSEAPKPFLPAKESINYYLYSCIGTCASLYDIILTKILPCLSQLLPAPFQIPLRT